MNTGQKSKISLIMPVPKIQMSRGEWTPYRIWNLSLLGS